MGCCSSSDNVPQGFSGNQCQQIPNNKTLLYEDGQNWKNDQHQQQKYHKNIKDEDSESSTHNEKQSKSDQKTDSCLNCQIEPITGNILEKEQQGQTNLLTKAQILYHINNNKGSSKEIHQILFQ